MSESNHVDIVLDGLPDDLESLITFVSGKFESLSTDEVATCLLAHDTRIAHKKSLASSVASINLAEGAKPNSSSNLVHQDSHPQAYVAQGCSSSSHSSMNYNNYNGVSRYVNSGAGRGGGGSSGQNFSRGGRNGGRSRGRFAHIAMMIMLPLSLLIIPVSILIKIKISLRPLLTPIRTSAQVRIRPLIPIRHNSLISLSTISTLRTLIFLKPI